MVFSFLIQCLYKSDLCWINAPWLIILKSDRMWCRAIFNWFYLSDEQIMIGHFVVSTSNTNHVCNTNDNELNVTNFYCTIINAQKLFQTKYVGHYNHILNFESYKIRIQWPEYLICYNKYCQFQMISFFHLALPNLITSLQRNNTHPVLSYIAIFSRNYIIWHLI